MTASAIMSIAKASTGPRGFGSIIVALRARRAADGLARGLVLVHLAMMRRLRLQLVAGARLAHPSRHDELVEEGHEEDREERGCQHAAHDARAHRLARAR